jgi:hypothetical protein
VKGITAAGDEDEGVGVVAGGVGGVGGAGVVAPGGMNPPWYSPVADEIGMVEPAGAVENKLDGNCRLGFAE